MSDKRTFRGSLSIDETAALRKAGRLRWAFDRGFVPVMAGGVTSYPDAIVNPLSAPTVATTTYTVDFLLQNPTRVTAQVNSLVMQNFFIDKVFNTGGDVQGGAVLYQQASVLDVYTDRDVERVQPGAEFPVVTGARIAPLVAAVEKFGGKFPVTDEAKRRNDVSRVTNQIRRLSNTITRKLHQRGLAELEAAVTAFTRTEAVATKWITAAEAEAAKVKKIETPMVGILKAIARLEKDEMGYVFDTLIIHPVQAVYGRVFYTDDAGFKSALSDLGVTNLIVTPRAKEGSGLLVAGRQVGEMRLEEPLRTITEREGAPEMREQTWVQTAVNPVFLVTDPYAALELTGI